MAFLARNFFKIPVQVNFQRICQKAKTLNFRNTRFRHHTSEESTSCIKCTLIPGDGVGPELVDSVQKLFEAAEVPIEFETVLFSEVNPDKSAPLKTVIKSIKQNRICLKAITAYPIVSPGDELETLNMKLRKALDLYANVVHVKSLPGIKTRHNNVDCIVIREHLEGEYSGLEHESVKGMVECLKIVTAKKSTRIAKFAFDYAMKNQRKRVTAVHKANIMKLGDGLFLRKCEEMSKLYPKIKFDTIIVDNCTMQLVHRPQQFDVLVTMNLYGSILENLAAGLVGGAGVVPGASYSAECVLFEPGARHIFIEGAGKKIANPTAMFLSAANLLKHVNLCVECKMIRNSVAEVLNRGKVRTKDLGGQASTLEFTKAVIENLKKP